MPKGADLMAVERARRLAREAQELRSEGALRRPLGLAAYAYSRLQRARGRRGSAAAAVEQAHRRDPASSTYAGEAGVELAKAGDTAAAGAIVERLLEVEGPGLADSRAQAALVSVALEDLRGARELAAEAIEAAPDPWPRRGAVALAMERAGEPSLALEQALLAGEGTQARRLEGSLRATDPAWAPELPATPLGGGRIREGGGRALCLLEASLPHTPSGYAYRSRALMRALREAGFEPVAATRLGFPATRGVSDWAPVESVDGVDHHRFGPRRRRGRRSAEPLDLQLQRNAELLLELAEGSRPTVIVAATPQLNGLLGLALRRATGVPLVYDVRGFPEMTWATRFGGAGSELYRRRRAAETRVALEADAVITLSGTMRAELLSRTVDAGKVTVVPHVVDAEAFSPRERPEPLARSYGLGGRFVVGCVSSLVDYEGIDVLLRALALARAESPDLAGLVVGEGPAREGLERLASELGIRDAVTFTGRVRHAEVPDHYALLDLFALPRRDLEVCRSVTPLKPFEALAMGIPLLASDLAAPGEIVSESGGGRLVPPDDPEALARAILDLASDRGARVELGAAGLEYARARHGPDAPAEALLAALAPLRQVEPPEPRRPMGWARRLGGA